MARNVVEPKTEAELARAVKKAARSGQALEIEGGGSKRGMGHPINASRILSTARLSGIKLYEPAALTLVVKAGTPLSVVEQTLAKNGQMLPFEPPMLAVLFGNKARATIGGTISCGLSGPRRIQAGAARDSLIGVRFVNGLGEAIKSGGRVMKNVTGYDLAKLLCGSHGTLGVLSELSFKLAPRPETMATILLHNLTNHDAVAALSAALTSPYDVTGAAHLPKGQHGDAVTMLRVEGFENSVRYRCEKLGEMLSGFGAPETISGRPAEKRWRAVREAEMLAGGDHAIWRLSVKPSDGPVVVNRLQRALEMEVVFDWGGGLVWLATPDEGDCGAELIRLETARAGGHATLLRAGKRAGNQIAVFHPESPTVQAISDMLRQKFDPAGILNPGRMRNDRRVDA